jgi:hypothetical protein
MGSSTRIRRWRELAIVAAGFTLATILLTFPLALHLSSIGRTDNADARLLIWNIAWVARTIIVDPLHVLDANIFYPHAGTLAYSETNLGAGLLAVPVYWATRSPYAAHNFATLASFVMAGTATYYLVRHLTGDRRAAAVAGICFGYCPYLFGRLPHIHLLMTAGLPLSLLALHRLSDDPTARRGVVLGTVMATQALFCGYYAVFVALAVGYSVLTLAALRRQLTDRRYWGAIVVAAGSALVLAVPLFLPYLRLQQSTGFTRTLDEARMWSADWRTYLASSATMHAWMLPLIGRWKEVLFPGFVAVVAGLSGLGVGWAVREGRGPRGRWHQVSTLYGSLVALAVWASLGPDAGLYRVLHATLPVFSLLRAPSRFGVVVALGLAVLAGLAIAALLERLDRARATWLAPTVTTALVALTLAELRVPLSFSPVPPVETAYQVLATLPRAPVLDVPVYSARFAAERTRYMLGSTAHWMPLIVGYSSYTPADFTEKVDVIGGFPSREAFKVLERDGARYAVFHMHLFSPAQRADLVDRLETFKAYLTRRYADDRVWLYEIVSFPA